MSQQEAAAWLAAFESGKLAIPQDVHDQEGWDRYWRAQIEVGGLDQGFSDMMSNDTGFIPALDRRGVRTILCVGNGLSAEAWALALHGFDVTALDISSVPAEMFRQGIADADEPARGMFTVRGDAAISFAPDVAFDLDSISKMHLAEGRPPHGGGSITHVTGDLTNPELCPGPFDAVIERRTLQLFPADQQVEALARLEARMAPRVLFVSHQHSGAWKPEEPRAHYARDWVTERGFTEERSPDGPSAVRAAWLIFTTG